METKIFLFVSNLVLAFDLSDVPPKAFKTRARWRNGLAHFQQRLCYLQGPGFESHLQPLEFFSCNNVSSLNNRIQKLTSASRAPII